MLVVYVAVFRNLGGKRIHASTDTPHDRSVRACMQDAMRFWDALARLLVCCTQRVTSPRAAPGLEQSAPHGSGRHHQRAALTWPAQPGAQVKSYRRRPIGVARPRFAGARTAARSGAALPPLAHVRLARRRAYSGARCRYDARAARGRVGVTRAAYCTAHTRRSRYTYAGGVR